jgi:hypothetical protein
MPKVPGTYTSRMPIPLTRSAGPFPPTAPAYRVEHREGGTVSSLGRLKGVPAHHATLTAFVSGLLRAGCGGELVLVDDGTGAVVARRTVAPFRSKAEDRVRRLRD